MAGRLSTIQVNLWQQGIRAVFRLYQAKAGLTQDEAWNGLREELTLKAPAIAGAFYFFIRSNNRP